MEFPLSGFKVTNESGYSEFQVEIPATYANALPGYRHVAGWFMDTRDPVVYENSSVIWEQFFREVSLTYVSVNCSEVLRKESVMVNVCVCSDNGVPLNGSVQVYWDNVELFNVSLFNGSSIFLLNISSNENVGFHVLNVTFNEINYDVSFCNVSIAVKSVFDTSINISSLDICRGENCGFEILVLDAFNQNPVSNVTVFAELNDNKIILEGLTDDNGSIFYLWHVPPGFQPGIYVVRFNFSKEFYTPLYLEFSIHVWIRTSIIFNVSVSENVLTQKLLIKTVSAGNMKAKASQQYNFTSILRCFLRRTSVDKQKTWKIIDTFSVKLQHIIKDEKLILLGRKKVRVHGKVKGFPSLRMF